MTDMIEAVARAICEASGDSWRTNDGLTRHAIAIVDREASNNHWLYKAQAAITAHTKALIEGAGDLVSALKAWAPLVSSGYEVPAAGQKMLQAAATIAAMKAEIERLTRAAALSDLIAECTFFLDKPDTLADSDGDDGA